MIPAAARERLWTLLGRLLLEPPVGPLGEVARHLPTLAPHLDTSDDELAAAHHSVFGMGVPPYASVFMAEDGMLGGPVSSQARAALEQTGAQLRTDVEPDHLGLLCLALGFLAGAEADAERDELPEIVARLHQHAAPLHRLLASALPGFVIALRREEQPLYAEVAHLLQELCPQLPGDPDPHPDKPLDNPRTSLAGVARYLLTPHRSGWYLTRHALSRVARSAEIPEGFGDRFRMLEGLLRGSVDHGALPRVTEALRAELRAWHNEAHALSLDTTVLRQRLTTADATLAELGTAARDHQGEGLRRSTE